MRNDRMNVSMVGETRGIRFGLAVCGAVLAAACSGSDSSTGDLKPINLSYTLQGVVADAVTGARVGGDDLKLYIVEGVSIRGPSRLNSDAKDPLVGEYAFSDIPIDFAAGNKTYKIVAVKAGYQRFESEITFDANYAGSDIDTIYNKIGNIYLFPLGSKAPDYDFVVTYNGKPVPNASVQLDPVTSTNVATFTEGSALPATNGYVASVQETTGADGTAKFPSASLALGAGYNVQVLPTVFSDSAGTKVQLGLFTGTTLMVGLSAQTELIALKTLVPSNGNNLYIVSTSNQSQGQLDAKGRLTVTFSAPVSLVNPNQFSAQLFEGVSASGTAAGTGVLAVPPAQSVTATLSADGLSLTLAPIFTTQPSPGDRGVSITYGDGAARITPKDYPAESFQLFTTLKFANETTGVAGTVAMTAP